MTDMSIAPTTTEQAQQGDPDALDVIIRATYDYVKGFLVRRAECYEDAEEATQECFLTMLTAIRRYEKRRAAFVSWLCAIGWRRLQRIERREALRAGPPIHEDMAVADGVERAVLEGLDDDRARHICALLGPYQRACLELRFVAGFDIAGAAALLGTTPRSVKYATFHGVEQIRAKLTEEMYHDRPDRGRPGHGPRNNSGQQPRRKELQA